jgi:large subunit ribosomal protein L3
MLPRRCIGSAWADKLSNDLGRKTELPEKHDGKKAIEKLEKMIDDKSEVRLLVNTNPRTSGIGKKTPELFESAVGGPAKAAFDYAKSKLGTDLKASDVLKQGEVVDARAVTQGIGYTGPVKRFGIRVRSRKNKHKMRHVGNLGAQNPPKVIPGGKVPEAGQMGFHNRTEYNKKILRIASGGLNPRGDWVSYGKVSGDYVIIEGSLPGPKKRLILLRPAMRKKGWNDNPIELKYVSLEPQN